MYGMFKKVNAREKIVGWYHTGPKLHQNDIAINELIRRYQTNSVLVVIDAKPKELGELIYSVRNSRLICWPHIFIIDNAECVHVSFKE